YFNSQLGNTPKQYLWSNLLGISRSLELCIGCGMCLLQCPLDIDLPRLISTARSEGLASWSKAIPNRALHDAWLMMHLAHKTAPAANRFLTNKVSRGAIEKATGFERDAWVPTAQSDTFVRWFRGRQGRGAGV
ncbi:4Fe-4S binding protein, partial [Chloroflexota bacterium]